MTGRLFKKVSIAASHAGPPIARAALGRYAESLRLRLYAEGARNVRVAVEDDRLVVYPGELVTGESPWELPSSWAGWPVVMAEPILRTGGSVPSLPAPTCACGLSISPEHESLRDCVVSMADRLRYVEKDRDRLDEKVRELDDAARHERS